MSIPSWASQPKPLVVFVDKDKPFSVCLSDQLSILDQAYSKAQYTTPWSQMYCRFIFPGHGCAAETLLHKHADNEKKNRVYVRYLMKDETTEKVVKAALNGFEYYEADKILDFWKPNGFFTLSPKPST